MFELLAQLENLDRFYDVIFVLNINFKLKASHKFCQILQSVISICINAFSYSVNYLKILFPGINKKIFYLVKLPSSISVEPLITDKDLIDEFVNGYQQYGDSYQDKLKIKRVLDNWLNVSPFHS